MSYDPEPFDKILAEVYYFEEMLKSQIIQSREFESLYSIRFASLEPHKDHIMQILSNFVQVTKALNYYELVKNNYDKALKIAKTQYREELQKLGDTQATQAFDNLCLAGDVSSINKLLELLAEG